jgi:hypothetical protein
MADSFHQEHFRRICQLEDRVDRIDSSGSCGGSGEGDDVHRQLVEVHRTHTEMHKQLLDVGVRLQQVEEAGAASGGGVADTKTVMEIAALTTRIVKLENHSTEIVRKVDDLTQKRLTDVRQQITDIKRVQSDMTTLFKYVTGEASNEDDRKDARHDEVKPGEWPLAWLERRVEGLITKKGGGYLEARMQILEKAAAATGSSELTNRMKKLELDLHALDVKDLGRVRPDLTEYQRTQEEVSRDLAREVKELKVVVGCVEACIPRETRKAVELFKRASGSGERVPTSPREFAMESKILALKEEMQGQIQGAQESMETGHDRMQAIVKGLEKKQDLLQSHIEDVRKGIPPLPELGELHQQA